MGWPAPRYAHHALMTDAAGMKLSKRDGALSLKRLRDDGLTPEEAFRRYSYQAASGSDGGVQS
jgi:glutamyl-Q tRNA(Asp) synthetase